MGSLVRIIYIIALVSMLDAQASARSTGPEEAPGKVLSIAQAFDQSGGRYPVDLPGMDSMRPGVPPDGRGPGSLHFALEQLDLNGEQDEAVRVLLDEYREALRESDDAVRLAQDALFQLGQAEQLDFAELEKAGNLLSESVVSDIKLKHELQVSILSLLSPDQQEQLKGILAQAPGPPGGRDGHGRW